MSNETIGEQLLNFVPNLPGTVEWRVNLAAAINEAVDRERQRGENLELDIVTLRDKLLQAERVRREEREACAATVERRKELFGGDDDQSLRVRQALQLAAAAIRARDEGGRNDGALEAVRSVHAGVSR